MTRVDFYILPDGATATDGLVMTACKLCDKASTAGQRVYINTADPAMVEALDGTLWSFRQGSFIAHENYHGQAVAEPLPTVLLGAAEPPATHHGVLLNLDTEVPLFFSRFERVCEIVEGDAAKRAKSRERFKFYKDRGYELKTFERSAEGGWAQRAKT